MMSTSTRFDFGGRREPPTNIETNPTNPAPKIAHQNDDTINPGTSHAAIEKAAPLTTK